MSRIFHTLSTWGSSPERNCSLFHFQFCQQDFPCPWEGKHFPTHTLPGKFISGTSSLGRHCPLPPAAILPSSPHIAVPPDVTLSLGSPLEDRLAWQTNLLGTKSVAVVISGMGLLLIPELIPHGSETRIIHAACSTNHVL